MRQKFQITMGVIIISFGLILLVSNLTGIRLWSYIWPLILISLGIWMVMRPARFNRDSTMQFRFLGGIPYRNNGTVKDENIVSFIGDVHMDLTRAKILPGETHIGLRGFVGDIDIIVPADIGIAVTSSAFVTSATAFGYKQDYFLTPFELKSDNFVSTERKISFDLGFFVTNLNVTKEHN
ncbi:MAG: hypothetical protein E4H27_07660 [Anaerolineales bacterium]|nr:MAG: hypothetical protein E4H27_07660 [Anaerolineales bacterium]